MFGSVTNAKFVTSCQSNAEACCRPAICEGCGQEMDKPQSWRKCDKCRDAEFAASCAKKEAERYAAATKVTEFTGWIYCQSLDGHNAGFFESVQSLMDFCQDEGEPMPDYCWTCSAIPFVHIGLDLVLGEIEANGYDDFDAYDCKGVQELKAALETFEAANVETVKYEPNYELAVILPAEVVALHLALLKTP